MGLTIARLLGALAALVLVILAIRAWRSSRDPRMARLGLGFTLLLVSLLVEGAAFELLGADLVTAHLLEAALQLGAFAVLIWALF